MVPHLPVPLAGEGATSRAITRQAVRDFRRSHSGRRAGGIPHRLIPLALGLDDRELHIATAAGAHGTILAVSR
jgi:hypothetical protein